MQPEQTGTLTAVFIIVHSIQARQGWAGVVGVQKLIKRLPLFSQVF